MESRGVLLDVAVDELHVVLHDARRDRVPDLPARLRRSGAARDDRRRQIAAFARFYFVRRVVTASRLGVLAPARPGLVCVAAVRPVALAGPGSGHVQYRTRASRGERSEMLMLWAHHLTEEARAELRHVVRLPTLPVFNETLAESLDPETAAAYRRGFTCQTGHGIAEASADVSG